jgi:galactokinase
VNRDEESEAPTWFVPGRVNLIGEHTDYNDGLALAIAIDLGVTATVARISGAVSFVHSNEYGVWRSDEPASAPWQRQASAVLAAIPTESVSVTISSDLPVGAGLSSSAAYLGALALALGASGDLLAVARLLQRCESDAGSDVGLLDQLTTLGARSHHALFLDFAASSYRDVWVPTSMGLTVVHSGTNRSLGETRYVERRRESAEAARQLGGWSVANRGDVQRIGDRVLRARARHVVSENERVLEMVRALANDDPQHVGSIVSESHESLRDDFDVSTAILDDLAEELCAQSSVFGARMLGGGFGGCVLAIHDPVRPPDVGGRRSWRVQPSSGAVERLGRSR